MSPSAPLRPCRQPGCAALVVAGYCAEHRQVAAQAYDCARGTTAERGYGPRHRAWRKVVLARDPVCRRCKAADSTVAHHVIALRDGGDFALENGMGVCADCHNALTAEERAQRGERKAAVASTGGE